MKKISLKVKRGLSFTLLLSLILTMGISALAENADPGEIQTPGNSETSQKTDDTIGVFPTEEQNPGSQPENNQPDNALTDEDKAELDALYKSIDEIYSKIFPDNDNLTNKEYKKRVAPYELQLDAMEERMVELEIKAGIRAPEKKEDVIYQLQNNEEEPFHNDLETYFFTVMSQPPDETEDRNESESDRTPDLDSRYEQSVEEQHRWNHNHHGFQECPDEFPDSKDPFWDWEINNQLGYDRTEENGYPEDDDWSGDWYFDDSFNDWEEYRDTSSNDCCCCGNCRKR